MLAGALGSCSWLCWGQAAAAAAEEGEEADEDEDGHEGQAEEVELEVLLATMWADRDARNHLSPRWILAATRGQKGELSQKGKSENRWE